MSGSFPIIRGDHQVRAWMATNPELEGKPELIQFLTLPTRQARRFRHRPFKHLDALYQVPFVPDHNVASLLLRLLGDHILADVRESYSGQVPRMAYNESITALKERLAAMRDEIVDRRKEQRAR